MSSDSTATAVQQQQQKKDPYADAVDNWLGLRAKILTNPKLSKEQKQRYLKAGSIAMNQFPSLFVKMFSSDPRLKQEATAEIKERLCEHTTEYH